MPRFRKWSRRKAAPTESSSTPSQSWIGTQAPARRFRLQRTLARAHRALGRRGQPGGIDDEIWGFRICSPLPHVHPLCSRAGCPFRRSRFFRRPARGETIRMVRSSRHSFPRRTYGNPRTFRAIPHQLRWRQTRSAPRIAGRGNPAAAARAGGKTAPRRSLERCSWERHGTDARSCLPTRE